jgi:pimeloyl-ACP methyl ester carboxylesterase
MKNRFHLDTHITAILTGLFALVPLIAAQQNSVGPAQQIATQSQPKPCKVPGVDEELLCGKLTVFENRRTRSGRMIDLNVVVLPALEQSSKEDPLFELAGGPGVAATSAASFYATVGREVRRRRDVVLVDQRGTGASNPLHCRHDTSPQYFVGEMYPVEYVRNCRNELESKADLTQYTTPVAMDDLDDVRAWLGYERINLIGFSYGTRAALVYMRQHPDRVRSALLAGVAPTYLRIPLHHARGGQRAMNLLLDECAADPQCGTAFPRIRRELKEVLAELARRPARVKYTLPETGAQVPVVIRGNAFAEKLRARMYAPETARRLPFIIHRSAMGDFTPFLKMVIPTRRDKPDFLADGMYLSVTCAEDTALIDPATAARMNRQTMFGDYRVFQQRRACGMWPRAELPSGYDQPVKSNIPVLIISGYMDPVTPPEWGESVAEHLPNSRHVVIHHLAHDGDGLSNFECLNKVILEFFARGDAKALDTSCSGQMLPPPFLIESQSSKSSSR